MKAVSSGGWPPTAAAAATAADVLEVRSMLEAELEEDADEVSVGGCSRLMPFAVTAGAELPPAATKGRAGIDLATVFATSSSALNLIQTIAVIHLVPL